MNLLLLVRRSLAWFWRTNLAATLGVAAAVAVLGGALLVGESIPKSLRRLAFERLGATDAALTAPRYVSADLAARLAPPQGPRRAVSLIAARAAALEESTGRRIGSALVYGVDETFWAFHGREPQALGPREALINSPAAQELGTSAGAPVVLKLQAEGDVSPSVIFGRRDSLGKTLRVRVKAIVGSAELGEFALRPDQRAPYVFFVPLATLQRVLEQPRRANTVLIAGDVAGRTLLGGALTLEDHGLALRPLPGRAALSLESRQALVSPPVVEATLAAAAAAGLSAQPVMTYLANSIRIGERTVPYSLVSGVGHETYESLRRLGGGASEGGTRGLILDEWAAGDLKARAGEPVRLEYFVWLEEGRIETRSADFVVEAVVPMSGPAADPNLTPSLPGISDALDLADWDPPFPVDLTRIRPIDEDYWDKYKTTPKAFIHLEAAEQLFGHRLGRATSVRIEIPPGTDLTATAALSADIAKRVDPSAAGIVVSDVRAQAEHSSRGTTDFGAYFLYFSFFLVVSALLLAALFFRLGIESRQRELGLLASVGFGSRDRGTALLLEGAVLATAGALIGAALSIGYTKVVLWALGTLWRDAVGTNRLALEPSVSSILIGMLSGIAGSLLAMMLALRRLRSAEPRVLLTGEAGSDRFDAGTSGVAWWPALAALLVALVLVVLAATGRVGAATACFGAGTLLLLAGLLAAWGWLRRNAHGRAPRGLAGLAVRGATHRPGRSLLAMGLVAAAAFVLVAVSAFRHEGSAVDVQNKAGASGGYTLMAESLVGVHHDFTRAEGREALGLSGSEAAILDGVEIAAFRLRDGDDTSCLNLYSSANPRIIGAPESFLRQGRFTFARSAAATPQEHQNPWLLLTREPAEGPIPAVADAQTLEYALHKKIGDEIVLADASGGEAARLKIVGALRPGLLQGELVVSESAFTRLFPDESGRRFFLIQPPPHAAQDVATYLESRLSDAGFDVSETRDRLGRFFAVENTYITTFQTLGGLGLLLGTFGLGAVLLRNAAERRRELALLSAVGFHGADVRRLVLVENLALLAAGLGLGALSALVAIAPAWLARAEGLAWTGVGGLLLSVTFAGGVVSWLAARQVRSTQLLRALRSE